MNPKCSLHFIFQKTLGNIQTTEFELMSRSFGKNLMIYNSLVNRLFIRNSTLLNKSKEIILYILFYNRFQKKVLSFDIVFFGEIIRSKQNRWRNTNSRQWKHRQIHRNCKTTWCKHHTSKRKRIWKYTNTRNKKSKRNGICHRNLKTIPDGIRHIKLIYNMK